MKQSITVGAQLLWSSRYGCNNGRYGCTIVMSYIEINKAVSQWLLTFNLCVSVTWPLTCAFHIPCTHTPEIIDMHRGMCDKKQDRRTTTWVSIDLISEPIGDRLWRGRPPISRPLTSQRTHRHIQLQQTLMISQFIKNFHLGQGKSWVWQPF